MINLLWFLCCDTHEFFNNLYFFFRFLCGCDFLLLSVKLLCYLNNLKLCWCYNFAKSSECYLLNLLPSVLLQISVLVLLIASLKIFICWQLILVWFQMAVVWLHMLLHMFQSNLHLEIYGYLISLKLLD